MASLLAPEQGAPAGDPLPKTSLPKSATSSVFCFPRPRRPQFNERSPCCTRPASGLEPRPLAPPSPRASASHVRCVDSRADRGASLSPRRLLQDLTQATSWLRLPCIGHRLEACDSGGGERSPGQVGEGGPGRNQPAPQAQRSRHAFPRSREESLARDREGPAGDRTQQRACDGTFLERPPTQPPESPTCLPNHRASELGGKGKADR